MSNLPVEIKKKKFFEKCIDFIKNIFNRKQDVNSNDEINVNQELFKKRKIDNLYKIENIKKIYTEKEKNKKMKEIIKIIEERPDILETLTVNKLKIIDSYYINRIEKCKEKLKSIVNT